METPETLASVLDVEPAGAEDLLIAASVPPAPPAPVKAPVVEHRSMGPATGAEIKAFLERKQAEQDAKA